MNNLIHKLTHLNRQTIYGILALGIILPLLFPLRLPEHVSPPVQRLYDYIESLPEGSAILLSVDFGPDVLPETYPMFLAVLRHALLRNIRVIGICLNPAGIGLGLEGIQKVAKELHKQYGTDYVYLGFKPNLGATMLGLGEDVHKVFPTDYYGTPIDSLPLFRNVRNYNDIALVVSFSGASHPALWVGYANARYGQKIAAGVTGVMAADYYPYLQTGQFVGMLAGMKGAAEYEYLVEKLFREKGLPTPPPFAIRGMDSISIAHLLIIVLVIIGNIGYFMERKQKGA